jgi:hypothetical protein
MKIALRVLIGVVILVAIVLAIKQFPKGGVQEVSSNSTPAPQKIGDTFTSAEHGYSHRIPLGWETKPPPPSKAAMIAAPKSSGVSSDMVTTVQPYDGILLAYVDANTQSLRKSAAKGKVVRAEFATDSKTPAYKVKLQNKLKDADVGQTIYFFQGPGDKKIIVTCTAPVELQAQLEPLFDACMKTFALPAR